MTDIAIESLLKRVQKPGRYANGEWNAVIKDWTDVEATAVISYPDVYEVGMSSLELQTLYQLLNAESRVLCERVFTPWTDMAAAMREAGLPLYSLESRRPLQAFDLVFVVLGPEHGYTNVLESLDLAGVPVKAAERDGSAPLVVGLGSGLANPEPLADFFDLFILGEPEGVLLELLDLFLLMKRAAGGRPHREAFLAKATRIPGVYVPSMFHAAHGGGSNAPARPVCRRISEPVRRSSAELRPALTRPVVPYLEALPDRGVVEVARDCGGSCRGCRAGSPCELPRRRSVEAVVDAIDALVRSCGYREIGLQAPDGDDYEPLMEIARAVRARYPVGELTLFLPPIQIPPDRPPDRALASAEMAFRMGWSGLRYRWVLGRPAGEGDRQIDIVQLVALTQETGRRILGRRPKVRVEASYHRPRPQMLSERSATMPPVDELQKLQTDLRKGLRKLGAHLSAPDPNATEVEAALAMGDRRVANVIFQAWRLGSTFDGWSQRFDSSRWDEAFRLAGLDPDLFIRRPRSDQETMPWSHIWSSGAGESTKPADDALPAACAEQPCPVCRYLEDDETPSPAAGAMADRC